MSKTEDYLQSTIFEAIDNFNCKKKFQKLSKREYQLFFVDLVKSLSCGSITLRDYKSSLHTLLENYRKDYPNV